jgi:hypothetical protein
MQEHPQRPGATSTHSPKPSGAWVMEQLTILAEAMDQSLTPSRLQIYASDLCDLSQEQIELALFRARRELKFFPKIAELRELVLGPEKERRQVEAQAAFQSVITLLERIGVDFLNLADLDPRIAYAVRRCGGFHRFNQQLGHSTYAFLERDFCEAYENFSLSEQIEPAPIWRELERELANKQLKGQVLKGRRAVVEERPKLVVIKKVPLPMTDAERRDRRETLAQQSELLKRRFASA